MSLSGQLDLETLHVRESWAGLVSREAGEEPLTPEREPCAVCHVGMGLRGDGGALPVYRLRVFADIFLGDHIYSEIADLLNEQGLQPGGSARPGCSDARFTALRVAYLVHQYDLRPRYDRLRERGMLTKKEAALRLGIHEATLIAWVKHGIITRHAYNGHAYLYETPGPNATVKHSSRWDRLTDRAAAIETAKASKPSHQTERGVV